MTASRRVLRITLMLTLLATPLAAVAQEKVAVVGFLGGATAEAYAEAIALIRQGLRDTGHVEGKNVTFEFRWADGQYDRLPALAADLVDRSVAVIITTGGPAPARAAKAATRTIPIVFAMGSDPVQRGLVPKLSGSGGNVTGVTFMNVALMPKRLEVIRESVPKARVFAMLVNPKSPLLASDSQDIIRAATASGVQVQIVPAVGQADPRTAFADIVQRQADGVLVHPDGVLLSRIKEIIALAARHRLPTIYFDRRCAEFGGLMSYGPNLAHVLRQAGAYAGRILSGEKPASLPVQRPTTFELVINLKTAQALGLTIPPAVLARADEVIQ